MLISAKKDATDLLFFFFWPKEVQQLLKATTKNINQNNSGVKMREWEECWVPRPRTGQLLMYESIQQN